MKKTLFHAVLLSALFGAPASLAQGDLPIRGPDYFRDAANLASTLGSAHAIRVRCNGRDDQYWRSYMRTLLDYEAPSRGNLRSSLVDRFNNAYSDISARYLACDQRAIDAEARFATDGQAISGRMAAHYFPKRSQRNTPE